MGIGWKCRTQNTDMSGVSMIFNGHKARRASCDGMSHRSKEVHLRSEAAIRSKMFDRRFAVKEVGRFSGDVGSG